MSDIERALKTIDRWSRHLGKLEPETVGDAVDIDMHQDDLDHLRGVVQAARQAPASGEPVAKVITKPMVGVEFYENTEFGTALLEGTKLYTHPPTKVPDEVIKAAVDRFLQWKLPADFYPDGGVSFDRAYEHDSPHWPVGTNILTAEQAEQMFRDCLLTTTPQPEGDGVIEPDLLWDYDNPEDSGHESAYELADYCALDMPADETMVVDVMCAKRMPNRKMKIWIDENDDLQWEWITPPQEQ